jgi:hypothetical protein
MGALLKDSVEMKTVSYPYAVKYITKEGREKHIKRISVTAY